MGTSLKVAGIRAAVKSLAKTILAADGVVVLINDRPLGKEWEGVFTHWVRGKCDAICLDMQRCMGELKAPPRLRPSTPGKALSSPVSNKATLSKGTASSVPSITAKAPSVKAPTKAKSSAILPARAPSKASAPKAPVVKTAVSKTVTKTITKKKTVEEKDAATKSPLLPINDTQKLVTGLLRQSKTSVAAAKDTKPKTIAVMAREPRAATSAKTRRPIAPL